MESSSYSVSTSDWLLATKDLNVSPYVDYYQEKAEPERPFTKTDFERVAKQQRNAKP